MQRKESSFRAGWSEERRKKEMEKAGARTSVVGCGLPRAEADAFREACQEQGRSCNAVLGDFCRAFTAAAASAPGVPLRVQVLPDVGGASAPGAEQPPKKSE